MGSNKKAENIFSELYKKSMAGNIECFKHDYKTLYSVIIAAINKALKSKADNLPLDLDNAFCTKDVLSRLIAGCEYLLQKKDYDKSDYEELNISVKRGKEILNRLTPTKAGKNDII